MKPAKASSKRTRAEDAKTQVLRRQGALHSHPEGVQDEAFCQGEFFDARDLVQVRYEMLRRHQVDGKSVTDVAESFGVSRQSFYSTEAAFSQMGIVGLLPRPRGPKRAHKCTDEILDFIDQQSHDLSAKSRAALVQTRFGIPINPRSLQRALMRRKKKR